MKKRSEAEALIIYATKCNIRIELKKIFESYKRIAQLKNRLKRMGEVTE